MEVVEILPAGDVRQASMKEEERISLFRFSRLFTFALSFCLFGCTTHRNLEVRVYESGSRTPAGGREVFVSPAIPFIFNAGNDRGVLDESGRAVLRFPTKGCYFGMREGEKDPVMILLDSEEIRSGATELALRRFRASGDFELPDRVDAGWSMDLRKPAN